MVHQSFQPFTLARAGGLLPRSSRKSSKEFLIRVRRSFHNRPMESRSLFVAAVESLAIDGALGPGDRFGDIFHITNDAAFLRSLLPRRFMSTIGGFDWDSILSGQPVIYCAEDAKYDGDGDAMRHLNTLLHQADAFLTLLWYARDNAAHMEMGFLLEKTIHRNFLGIVRTSALGDNNTVRFFREELRGPRLIFSRFAFPTAGNAPQVLSDPVGRWGRADYFVAAARSSPDLGVKIANYCTAFEALFSTDTAELSHKLAERIAVFLEDRGPQRAEVYKTMKHAYGIRSKIVHGAQDRKALTDEMRTTSVICDDLCRRALTKILTDPEAHGLFGTGGRTGTVVDEFFLKRLFES